MKMEIEIPDDWEEEEVQALQEEIDKAMNIIESFYNLKKLQEAKK